MTELNERQARFVAEYLVDSNATAAALRAGCSVGTACSTDERTLRNVKVAEAVAKANRPAPARPIARLRGGGLAVTCEAEGDGPCALRLLA